MNRIVIADERTITTDSRANQNHPSDMKQNTYVNFLQCKYCICFADCRPHSKLQCARIIMMMTEHFQYSPKINIAFTDAEFLYF